MTVFSATFAAVAVSAAQDVFELLAASPQYVTLREIVIAQYSDFGDAEAELISVQLIRGHTTTGSGGAAVTAQPLFGGGAGGSAPTALSTVARNNTTVASAGTGLVLRADTFNVAAGWVYRPPADERIVLYGGTAALARLACRITAPTDGITMNGTMIFEEGPAP